MTYEKISTNAACVLRFAGDVDMTDKKALERLEDELRDPCDIIVDVESLRYADTTFLRFLVRLRSQIKSARRGSVRLVGANRNLRRVLDVTGLSALFR
jgi:anti-anti-sigma factor